MSDIVLAKGLAIVGAENRYIVRSTPAVEVIGEPSRRTTTFRTLRLEATLKASPRDGGDPPQCLIAIETSGDAKGSNGWRRVAQAHLRNGPGSTRLAAPACDQFVRVAFTLLHSPAGELTVTGDAI